MIIVLVGSVVSYVYYLKEKKEELMIIQRGFCPRCKKNSIELVDEKGGGCSGTKLVVYECMDCGYTNSFSIENNSGCGL